MLKLKHLTATESTEDHIDELSPEVPIHAVAKVVPVQIFLEKKVSLILQI